jgi:acyl-coenzyme A thioesterase PaaI-like protein
MEETKVRTHRSASARLLGTPLAVEDDSEALVELETTGEMVVDEMGLIHGGFTFGLADYAAMLAVNHPNVVLAEAKARFTAPVALGDRMKAHARVVEKDGRRRRISVEVTVGDRRVMEGEFLCLILGEHVLSRARRT